MEEKVVCFYCGTVYLAAQDKCPLCGGTLREENPVIPQERERITQEDRKERQKEAKVEDKKKKAEEKESSSKKGWLIAAVIFLSLAVLVLFWFIADMLGWVPGLEDHVDRTTEPGVTVNHSCTVLKAEPTELHFALPGETLELKLSVNTTCEDVLYCNSTDTAVAEVSNEAVTAEDSEFKSVTFTVTAIGQGNTTLTVTCGNQKLDIPVVVAVTQDSTEPTTAPTEATEATEPDYIPELNFQEVELTKKGETVELKIANPVEGEAPTWTSSDTKVATVDEKGVVTALATGTAEITCTLNGAEAKVTITCTIKEEEPTTGRPTDNDGAHLETTDATVKVGERFPLFLYDLNGKHLDDIQYKIDDASICEVKNNYVKALKKGTTKVRVIYKGEEYICIVRVK